MENFVLAADSRLEDWEVLQREQRKIATIHLGGIYIECLLKGIICSKHCVVEGSRPGKWKIDGTERTRPSHDLTASEYRSVLTDIYDDMSEEVENALKYINEPECIEYIDYRYMGEDDVTQAIYDKWQEQFIKLFNYLHDKKHEI